jgi:predicted dehydrogenase
MDFVAIVTPNHVHYEPAVLALRAGFDVVLDKPMCLSLKEAQELSRIVDETGRTLCLTHTYTGYPMVKQARQMVARNDIGLIRKVYVEYPQGWLSHDDVNSKQAKWRLDPQQSGPGGCLGDIGTHAFNLAEYVTGLQVTHVCADLRIVIEGRQLDDDASVFLRFNNGANGVLMASQVILLIQLFKKIYSVFKDMCR